MRTNLSHELARYTDIRRTLVVYRAHPSQVAGVGTGGTITDPPAASSSAELEVPAQSRIHAKSAGGQLSFASAALG